MSKTFALVPAAGTGSRMELDIPKQYAPLCGKPLIAHCLDALSQVSRIERIFVVIAPDDELWAEHCAQLESPRLVVLPVGGASRAQSVANGLAAMGDRVGQDDWVLVHDAARACLEPQAVDALIDALADDAVGGLLAVPLADTLKRANDVGRVAQTVPREALWQAQTPQMFRRGLLERALAANRDVTDEASAIEALGLSPRLVASSATNFKITQPFDLQLASWVLQNRTTT